MTGNGSSSAYDDMLREVRRGPLYTHLVPSEHEKSLPFPTLRAGVPGFAGYARAAGGVSGLRAAPDRWFVVDRRGRELLLYARTSALTLPSLLSHGQDREPGVVQAESADVELSRLLELRREFSVRIGELSDAFFRGEAPSAEGVEALRRILRTLLKGAHEERAIAQDFFTWLDGN